MSPVPFLPSSSSLPLPLSSCHPSMSFDVSANPSRFSFSLDRSPPPHLRQQNQGTMFAKALAGASSNPASATKRTRDDASPAGEGGEPLSKRRTSGGGGAGVPTGPRVGGGAGGKNLLDRMGGAQGNESEFILGLSSYCCRSWCWWWWWWFRSSAGRRTRTDGIETEKADLNLLLPSSLLLLSLPPSSTQSETTKTPSKPRSTPSPRIRLRWELPSA